MHLQTTYIPTNEIDTYESNKINSRVYPFVCERERLYSAAEVQFQSFSGF